MRLKKQPDAAHKHSVFPYSPSLPSTTWISGCRIQSAYELKASCPGCREQVSSIQLHTCVPDGDVCCDDIECSDSKCGARLALWHHCGYLVIYCDRPSL